jgi:Tol biopolymer transport system component
MNADGSNPRQLTIGGTDMKPCFSPDGKWVIYESFINGVPMLWKVGIDGVAGTQLTSVYSSGPIVSPDGKTIACRYLDKKVGSQKIGLITLDGGQLTKTFDIPVHYWQQIRWTTDGRALTYTEIHDGIANIWSQPVDGGKPKQLTDFKNDLIFSYDWSSDGKQLACERGIEASDVVLIADYIE